MPQLSEKELALLSALIYCDEVVNPKYQGKTLEELVNDLLEITKDNKLKDLKIYGDIQDIQERVGEEAAAERFRKEVLFKILKSDHLKKLTIAKQLPNDGTTSGITAACFAFPNSDDAATVVFRGTDSSYKAWFDNLEGAGTDLSTPMQDSAKQFIDGLEYENITVTGHSKGGNLAAFVTILCDKVTKGVSFDGQGFNEVFLREYESEIAEKEGSLKTIAGYKDFVNILLFSVGETIYVENNNDDDFLQNHYMTNLIRDIQDDGQGNFIPRDQDESTKTLETVLDMLLKLMPDSFEERFTDTVGAIASLFLGKEKTSDDWLHAINKICSGLDIVLSIVSSALVLAEIAIIGALVAVNVTATIIAFNAVIDAGVEFGKGLVETGKNYVITLGYAVENIGTGLRDLFVGIFTLDGDTFIQGLLKIVYGGVLVLYSGIMTVINVIIDVINLMINIVIGIVKGVGGVVTFVGGLFGQDWRVPLDILSPVPKLPLPAPSMFESGGFPAQGQRFIARETGPELVGRLNGRTAVVNNDQIVESVSTGVYSAFISALCKKKTNAPAVARVYLDGKQIAMAGQV